MEEVPLILTLMDKGIRQFSLYGRDHPQAGLALRDLETRLTEFLQRAGQLDLTIKRTDVEWNGASVFKPEKRENNYVQQMYVDGIRQLSFLPGVTSDEIRNLLAVLARDTHLYEQREDDTVTLLWKSGFQRVFYQTVDIYAGDLTALMHESLAEEDPEDDQQDDRKFAREFVQRLIAPENKEEAAIPPLGPEGTPRNEFASEISKPIRPERFRISDGERVLLGRESSQVGSRDYLAELRTIHCEILEATVENDEFRSLTASYLTTTASLLKEGRIRTATEWLEELRRVEQFSSERFPPAATIVEEEIRKVLSEEFFATLGKQFQAALPGTPDDWISLFLPLKEYSGTLVVELLGHLNQETIHSRFIEYLVAYVPTNTELYLSKLTHPGWMVVRDMVKVLGQLLEPAGLVSALTKVAAHPNPDVRLEVLRAASSLPKEAVRDLLRRGLKDPNEEIRSMTIRLIAQHRDPHHAKHLAEIANSEEFLDRDPLEKRRYLMALARCAGVSALAFLSQILERTRSTEREQELCVAALFGLAEIQDPRAEKAIRDQASRLLGSRTVKETARQLLQKKASGREEDPT